MLEIYNNHRLFDHRTYCDRELIHCYISQFYERFFHPFRDKKIDLLEIGIHKGGGILLWHNYFSNANIHGVDHEDILAPEVKQLPNFTFYHAGSYTEPFINQLGQFDFIIDDGTHAVVDQVFVIQKYYDKLKPGGYIIIEDIAGDRAMNILVETAKNMQYKIVHDLDLRYVKNRYDDMILFLQK